MKKFLIFIFITISTLSVAQNKYTYKKGLFFFEKAKKYYSKKDFKRSLFFIEKYEKSRLGYCGSEVVVAINKIREFKVYNYIGLKKYDEALEQVEKNNELNGLEFQRNDSLKVEILFLKFGKDKVKQAFNATEDIYNKNEKYGIYNYQIKLEDINYDFYFKVYKSKISQNIFNSNSFKNFYFISYGLSFHSLIFDENSNSKVVEFSFIKKDGNNLNVNYSSIIDKKQYDKLSTYKKDLVHDLIEQNTKIKSSSTNQSYINFFIKTNIDFENNLPKKFKIEKIIYDQNQIGKIENTISIEFDDDDYKSKNLDSQLNKLNFTKAELDKILSEIYENSPFIIIK